MKKTQEKCGVADCDRPFLARDMCWLHYSRWLGQGGNRPPCAIEGCDKPANGSRGWCRLHYRRWQSTGDPEKVLPHGVAETHVLWQGGTIWFAHDQVKRLRGSARNYVCVQCGEQAKEWAYDLKDPDERKSSKGYPFSLRVEHYQPMCVRCHRRMDAAHRKMKGRKA